MRNYGTMQEEPISKLKSKTWEKEETIKSFKKLLEEKRERIQKLEAEKAALAEKGKTLHPDDEALLKRLYIKVRDIKESIGLVEQNLRIIKSK